MSTPTYQVVGFGGKTHVSPLQFPLSTVFIGALNLKKAVVSPLSFPKGSTFFGVPQWGNPWSMKRGAVPIQLNKSNFAYNWRFYYPSNGKVPGSPIPHYGQLLPRPL